MVYGFWFRRILSVFRKVLQVLLFRCSGTLLVKAANYLKENLRPQVLYLRTLKFVYTSLFMASRCRLCNTGAFK